jgi:transposase
VPETLGEVKTLVAMNDSDLEWKTDEDFKKSGYKITSTHSNYGNISQRWILVYSQQAYDREKKTFEKNFEKKTTLLEKALWHLSNQVFGCEADISRELTKMQKEFPLHSLILQIEPILKNPTKGRPKQGDLKIINRY